MLYHRVKHGENCPNGLLRIDRGYGRPAWALKLPVFALKGRFYDINHDGFTNGWHFLTLFFRVERMGRVTDLRFGWGWAQSATAVREPRETERWAS